MGAYNAIIQGIKGIKISWDEYFYSYYLTNSWHIVVNNEFSSIRSADHWFIIGPLLDFINHSFDPNCVITFEKWMYKEKEQDTFILKSLRPINIGE